MRARSLAACARVREVYHPAKLCAAAICKEPVGADRLFCLNHWYCLPDHLREAIRVGVSDANWAEHYGAVAEAADWIDKTHLEARALGFDGIMATRCDDTLGTLMWKVL